MKSMLALGSLGMLAALTAGGCQTDSGRHHQRRADAVYISYRQPDDTWGPAINLDPEINGVGARSSWPQLSNGWGNIYWVDTSFVDRLRPAEND